MVEIHLSSREYKLVLNASRFCGEKHELMRSAGQFWKDFTHLAMQTGVKPEGDLSNKDEIRLISFYDTDKYQLNNEGYIFRLRKSTSGQTEATLKFRHLDQFITLDRDMKALKGKDPKTKLEHDVKSIFDQLQSYSTTVTLKEEPKLKKLNDLCDIFPGLARDLSSYSANEPIARVNDFEARETTITGATFALGKSHNKEAECALIIWYHGEDLRNPRIVEFSFRYKDKQGNYSRQVAWEALAMYSQLQKLTEWIDLDSPTKTQFVYRWQG